MFRTKPWTRTVTEHGVARFDVRKWQHFPELIQAEFLLMTQYVWRGQRSATWKLLPTLDRCRVAGKDPFWQFKHRETFDLHARRRRGEGVHPVADEDQVWALGQHFGLKTPLLDWTSSPFVAAFFAFLEQSDSGDDRAIWALSATSVQRKSAKMLLAAKRAGEKADPDVLEMVWPVAADNARLISQSGLFTRAPAGMSVEDWVTKNFQGQRKGAVLLKIVLPDEDRHDCLRMLNRMNINHKSLFPDLGGVSEYCNLCLEIPNYGNELWPKGVPGWSKGELQKSAD